MVVETVLCVPDCKATLQQFNKLIGEPFAREKLADKFPKIAELCLRVIGNMSINH